jgi:peroxiredoxin
MMEVTLLASRLLLASVFLLAGVAKLADRGGSSEALRGFGLPAGIARPLSLLLSTGEIAISAALVPIALAWYGACGALALLSLFALGIVANLVRGRKPECHCFGQLHSAPVGWPTLVRTGVLAIPAAGLVLRGPLQVGPSVWAHLASAGGNERRVFIVAGCLMCVLLFRALQPGEPPAAESGAAESEPSDWLGLDDWGPNEFDPAESRRPSAREINVPKPEGPPPRLVVPLSIGAPAPEFALPNITGQKCSLRSLLEQRKAVVLVFTTPYCDPCRALLPVVRGWMLEHRESLTIVVISRGTAKENLPKLKDFDVSRVLLQQAFEVSEIYGCTATPAAVVIGTDGMVQSDLVVGRVAIEALISSSQGSPMAGS